jgi:hypothetical protein
VRIENIRTVALYLVVIFCSGCVTAEGIGLGSDSYVNQGFVKYGGLPTTRESTQDAEQPESDATVTRLILVGNLSAFRDIDDSDVAEEYARYLNAYEAWESDRPPSLSLSDFSESIAGWTRVKIMGVPLLFAGYVKSLVSKDIVDIVGFEPAISTFLFQSSSDLVAARTNDDGAFVVISHLCPDTAESATCRKAYKKGLYDAATGVRIKSKLKLDENGPVIDTETFQLIKQPSSYSHD